MRSYRWIGAVILWAGVIMAIGAIANRFMAVSPSMQPYVFHGTAFPLERWDVSLYDTIATRGYATIADAAFFPAYPLLLGALHHLIPVILPWLGSLFSLALFIGALVFVRDLRIVRERHAEHWITVMLCLLPTAFVFIIPYSESLFLCMTALTLWALERQRGGLATVAVIIATLARPFGVFLIIPLATALFRHGKDRAALLAVGAVFATSIGWSMLIDAHLGSRFVMLTSNRSIFHAATVSIPHQYLNHATSMIFNNVVGERIVSLILILAAVTALGSLMAIRRILGTSWLIATACMLALAYAGAYPQSTSRHVFSMLPIILAVGLSVPQRYRAFTAILSGMLLIAATILFARWYFVV